ncbi:MAG TPA: L-threonylcarbamoyladenylate synthase [Candidatus Binatia bacterium]|jgi:L-threonylcarbamoyladenylate synthase|nr:L-threonylcarbamoyladenylate synthase [Candidatus Binatia bacterium]
MRIIKIDRRRVSKKALAEAAAVLRAGGVIVMPTETAYGLAADPAVRAAVASVFRIKGRPGGKPLPLIAASAADVRERFVLAGPARKLATAHWPGPLTLVLPYKRGGRLPASPGPTAAVRVPASVWARALAKAAGGLITSTSANVSGEATLYDAAKVVASFRGRRTAPALVLDAGKLPVRRPSTIAALKRGKMVVLRPGAVKVESR